MNELATYLQTPLKLDDCLKNELATYLQTKSKSLNIPIIHKLEVSTLFDANSAEKSSDIYG